MDLHNRYEKLSMGTFDDQEVSEFAEIHPRALRELAKWGVIKKAVDQRGAGKKRLWAGFAIKRVAGISALNRAGLSLPLAGRISFYSWMNLRLVNNLKGLPNWEWLNSKKGENHTVRRLIDRRNSRVTTDPYDLIVRVLDGNLVFLEGRPKVRRADGDRTSFCLGRLTPERDGLLIWEGLPRRMRVEDFRPANPTYSIEESKAAFDAAWKAWRRDIAQEFGNEIDPQFLAYIEDPNIDKPYAKRLLKNFQSELNVNLTMAMKIALRRALDLPVTYP